MIKIGTKEISAIYLGSTQIQKAYLGEKLVYRRVPVYTIAASIDPSGSGTVTGAGQYQEGETVTLTATVSDGYTFTGWQENGAVVSTENPYTFTAAGDRAFTAVFAVASGLPAGYTELEYIQVSGNVGFDTGIKPTQNLTGVVMDLCLTESLGTNRRFFSTITESDLAFSLFGSSGGSVYLSVSVSGSYNNMGLRSNFPLTRTVVKYDPLDKKAWIGSTSYPVKNCGIYTFKTNLHLFCASTGRSAAPCKLYSAQVLQNGTLARDFVPCQNASGSVGLFDLVGREFHQHSYSGSVAPGPAV